MPNITLKSNTYENRCKIDFSFIYEMCRRRTVSWCAKLVTMAYKISFSGHVINSFALTGAGIKLRRWQRGRTDKSIIIIYLWIICISAERWALCHDKIYYYWLNDNNGIIFSGVVSCTRFFISCTLCSNKMLKQIITFVHTKKVINKIIKETVAHAASKHFLTGLQNTWESKWRPFLFSIHIP